MTLLLASAIRESTRPFKIILRRASGVRPSMTKSAVNCPAPRSPLCLDAIVMWSEKTRPSHKNPSKAKKNREKKLC